MPSLSFRKKTFLTCVIAALYAVAAYGSTEKVIYSFAGGSDGELPSSNLIADSKGNLYGTTSEGGNTSSCGPIGGLSCGVVFELTPSGSGWTETILHTFTGTPDGGTPYAGLVMDAAGNLYGTTNVGGTSGLGTVFELSPNGDGTWTETILHSFAGGNDGAYPRADLILKGNSLAGTTLIGGSATGCEFGTSCGTVFEMTYTNKGWTEAIVYTFQGGADGGIPYGGLVMDNAGNLYGTTTQYGNDGYGTVFELTSAHESWKETTLYTFTGGSDGGYPEGTLIFDPSGNLYGTTTVVHRLQAGTVFQLQKGQGGWSLRTLHTFTGAPDGLVPEAGLVRRGGSVYGTTFNGGTGSACGLFGGTPCGTVFELSRGEHGVEYSVVYSFQGTPDAAEPQGSLWIDSSGNLYGTGFVGGADGEGAVFEIAP